jgi:hypothetical protein
MAGLGSVNTSAEPRHMWTETGFHRDSSPDTNTRSETMSLFPVGQLPKASPAGRLQVIILTRV